MTLAHVAYRVAIDAAFADRLLHDPQAALTAAGLQLDEEATEAVLAVLRRSPHWAELCSPAMDPPEGFWG